MKAVTLLSGGLDSTTLAYLLKDQGYHLYLLSFDYGQRHRKELEAAASIGNHLGVWDVVKLGVVTPGANTAPLGVLLKGSSLTDTSVPVPDGHYAAESMKATVVPNRNMIMLSIAGGIAVAEGANGIATGVHAGDHFIYPDCRPDFIEAASHALAVGNEGFGNLFDKPILTPFINWTKAEIARAGISLGVDFSQTWSCYKGGEKHCGKCGTCVERLEAIDEAVRIHDGEYYNQHGVGSYDKTEYEDSQFWRNVVAEAARQ